MLLEYVGNGNRNAFERVGGGGGVSLFVDRVGTCK